MADLKEFAEQLVNLTVKEVNELADILKQEYGIEPDVFFFHHLERLCNLAFLIYDKL